MNLPHLDQHVPLHRGQAFTAGWAIGRFLHEATTREQYRQRLYWQEALSLGPLQRLQQRLLRRARSESTLVPRAKKPATPRLLRVPFDELVALRECQASIQALFPSAGDVATALGALHQKSTALESYIRFSD